jgi:transcriptional regulator with XRE-family HTH domain
MDEAEAPGSLGVVIKARRRQLGWSQEELAKRIVAHGDRAFRQTDVSRLELGKVALPHRDRLAHIAAVLDLPLGTLLAQSGWAGAEAAFRRPGLQQTSAQAGAIPAAVASDYPTVSITSRSPVSLNERLRDQIALADATISRSKAILEQCEVTRDHYDRASWMTGHQLDPSSVKA